MPITPAVEEPTRRILGAVLHDDVDTVEATADGLVKAGLLDESLSLALRITAVVVINLDDGNAPTAETVTEIARDLASMNDVLTVDETQTLLGQVVFGDKPLQEAFSTEDAVRVPYVVAATLVGSVARTEDGQQWTEYLDQVEAAIEAASDPS